MIYSPIFIPTLCRFEHFKQCIESLAQCVGANETEVYVALDYPAKEEHRDGYEKIKDYLETAGDMTFKKLHVHKRDHNYGLGVHGNSTTMRNYITERYDRFIVSEDDNVFSPNYLIYMNTCFEKYKDDPDVIAVCGYSYPVDWDVSEGATVLRQQFNVSAWGVGFWTDKYRKFYQDLKGGILKTSFGDVLKKQAYKKMIDACLIEYVHNACNVQSKMNGLFYAVSVIAMREYLVVADKYAITPVVSKVRNLGFDGTGVYCQKIDERVEGNTAGTFNYAKQRIDESHTFSLVESTKDCTEENRRCLNAFDYRSPREMKSTRILLWESENIGVWAAKLSKLLKTRIDKLTRKNYIIIGAMGGYISGAPIYYRNKALYMQSQGWNVYIVSCRSGKVYVDRLEQFIVGTVPELTRKAYCLSGSKREAVVKKVTDCLPSMDGEETVIETGTFYTAYWGEILAKELGARHIVVYLDEHNYGIHSQQMDFFKFKYEREELACISEAAYKDIFSPAWKHEKERAHTLPCYCSNSLEDIHSPVTHEVKRGDYTVGYIGRLEKDAFRTLVEALYVFAKMNPDKTIALDCFGDYGNPIARDALRQSFAAYPNLQLYISGYLFPIPKEAVQKCDICFASAGSIAVSVKANVPTIAMNVYSNLPDGFRINAEDRRLNVKCPNCTTVLDYLNVFFIGGFRPEMHPYDLCKDILLLETYLSKHMAFIDSTKKYPQEYYDMNDMGRTMKERVKTLLDRLRDAHRVKSFPLISSSSLNHNLLLI